VSAETAFHLSPSLILLIVAVAALGAISKALDRRARARRVEARSQRQREYREYLKTEGWKARRQVALDRALGAFSNASAPRRSRPSTSGRLIASSASSCSWNSAVALSVLSWGMGVSVISWLRRCQL
jgi:hypothetical protein